MSERGHGFSVGWSGGLLGGQNYHYHNVSHMCLNTSSSDARSPVCCGNDGISDFGQKCLIPLFPMVETRCFLNDMRNP